MGLFGVECTFKKLATDSVLEQQMTYAQLPHHFLRES